MALARLTLGVCSHVGLHDQTAVIGTPLGSVAIPLALSRLRSANVHGAACAGVASALAASGFPTYFTHDTCVIS